MFTLTIVDETPAGEITGGIEIPVASNSLTVKDIIASRVHAEVERYNEKLSDGFTGLVRPTDAEQLLNGFRMRKPRKIDAEKQVYVALAAFQANGFFVFVDNKQVDNLEQRFELRPGSRVSFVKLTPLVGG